MQWHPIIAFCAKLSDEHLKFECSVLHSNVDFYFKFDEYFKFDIFFWTALFASMIKWKDKVLDWGSSCTLEFWQRFYLCTYSGQRN